MLWAGGGRASSPMRAGDRGCYFLITSPIDILEADVLKSNFRVTLLSKHNIFLEMGKQEGEELMTGNPH